METSMSLESTTQNVQVNVGGDLSTAIIQGIKVEVRPDSNVVVYTNDGVQTKGPPRLVKPPRAKARFLKELSRVRGTGVRI
jgi:hypothetical protein